MTRIAYLLPDPGIRVGGVKGASVHVQEVCRALRATGCEVLLIAARAVGDPPPGVKVELLEPDTYPRGPESEPARIRGTEAFFRRAEPLLRKFQPDLIYERLSLFAGGGGALAARLGVPRLLEVNAPIAAEHARHFGLALRSMAETLENAALAGASVVAVSPPLATWALARGAARAVVVPNGADIERFDPATTRVPAAALRASLGFDRSEVVGFVGSLKPWHGVDVLLDAAHRLAAERPSLRVLIVGDGPRRDALEAKATGVLAGVAHFTGAVPSEAVPQYVAAFDIAVAPYLPDADADFYFSPLKVVEAMAAARPIVASRFPSIAEMLGTTGRLVEPAEPAALACALRDLLDDERGARKLGEAARRRARSRFTWSAVAARILALAAETSVPHAPSSDAAHELRAQVALR